MIIFLLNVTRSGGDSRLKCSWHQNLPVAPPPVCTSSISRAAPFCWRESLTFTIIMVIEQHSEHNLNCQAPVQTFTAGPSFWHWFYISSPLRHTKIRTINQLNTVLNADNNGKHVTLLIILDYLLVETRSNPLHSAHSTIRPCLISAYSLNPYPTSNTRLALAPLSFLS